MVHIVTSTHLSMKPSSQYRTLVPSRLSGWLRQGSIPTATTFAGNRGLDLEPSKGGLRLNR